MAAALAPSARAQPLEPVVTVLADFEDDSIAPAIGDLQNAAASDCAAKPALIPARGQRCLAIEIGATAKDAYAACDLTFRVVTTFAQADRIAAFCWIKQGAAGVAFRVRDARGQVFETAVQPVRQFDRWVRIEADLTRENLRRIAASSPPRGAALPASQPAAPWDEFGDHAIQWPVELRGFRVVAPQMGKQLLFIDDIQVEHRAAPADTISGHFTFDRPTKIYAPGRTVAAKVNLENRSRTRPLRLAVELGWFRPDGTVLRTQQGNVQLPASGIDFRARQAIDFSLKLDEPGLYRLVARVRAAAWKAPNVFETIIAVQPSNRDLPRGRSTFFGVRTNLLREPRADQLLEIEAARDIGAHLLAIDVPWRLIEPKRDTFDFAALDPLVDAVATHGVAVMLSLTEPPEWLAGDSAALPARQALLLEALTARFGAKVQYYQLLPPPPGEPFTATAAALTELQSRIAKLRPEVRVVAAPAALDAATPAPAPAETAALSPAEWAYESQGPIPAARRALANFGRAVDGGGGKVAWAANHRWFHVAGPLIGAGHLADAEELLNFFVDAAAAGVSGLVWFDLRDDDNDPASPARQNGLLQRDFSPKATLWGFASAVGLLTGLRHAGEVHGAPPEFWAALFVGSAEQMALLQPRPNRIRPAVLAPIRGVPGQFTAQDFERRSLRLLESGGPPLLLTPGGPAAVTLKLESAQPLPQIGFAKPWIRVPAMVFADPARPFTVEIDPPLRLQRSYLQIVVPDGAPYTSSLTARALSGPAGETIATEVQLTPRAAAPFTRATLVLKLSLEGQTLEVPLDVRPALAIGAAPATVSLTAPERRIAELSPRGDEPPAARGQIFGAWTPEALRIAIQIEDDRPIAGSDRLLIGIAQEGADAHFEVTLAATDKGPALEHAFGHPGPALRNWRVTAEPAAAGQPRIWTLTIPAAAFGPEPFGAGRHVLLAARYADRDRGDAATELVWGGGLDGGRSTADFTWLRLQD